MLYRSMGFRIAIDDLGEGFASLRLWSELRPEYVKADKHFVTGIADDPVKVQFLRAIQHIADNCGSLVIAEGIENAADFKVVKDIGIACGQGWFIGHPAEQPDGELPAEARRAQEDARVPVVPTPRLRAGTEPQAHDFVRAVEPRRPARTARRAARAIRRQSPALARFPWWARKASKAWYPRSGSTSPRRAAEREALDARSCIEFTDRAPIRVEASLDLAALTAILVESDARRFADGFVIVLARPLHRHGHQPRRDALAADARACSPRATRIRSRCCRARCRSTSISSACSRATCRSRPGSSRWTRCAGSTTRADSRRATR